MQRRDFIILWALLFLLHGACAVFLLASARLHWYLAKPNMSYYADLLAPSKDRYLRLFGSLLGILASMHVLEWLRLIAESIRIQSLAVPGVESVNVLIRWLIRYAIAPCRRFTCRRVASNNVSGDSKFSQRRLNSKQVLLKASTMFSIHSSKFESVFIIRKAIVITAQFYQCTISSSRIAHPWINHLAVAFLLINNISATIFYPRLRQNHSIARSVSNIFKLSWQGSHMFIRLMCYVLDGILTFTLSVVLPTVTFMPYLVEYDGETMNFSINVLYGETEFPNLVRESQTVFACSLLGGFYKLVLHTSLYVCLVVIASAMREQNISTLKIRPVSSKPLQSAINSSTPDDTMPNHPVFFMHGAPNGVLFSNHISGPQTRMKRSVRLLQRAISPTFMLVAIAIIIIHTRAMLTNAAGRTWITPTASNDYIKKMCAQPVYSWFASGSSCAVIKYNCYRQGVDTSPPSDVFDALDPSVVSNVIFMHCSGLVVPSSIQRFTNLLAFEIFNSTLVEWSAEAALTNDFHPNIVYLAMALVNMTELPPGVLQSPFPQRLLDIEISRTNLTALPPCLPEVWSLVQMVFLEYSHLTEVPRELFALPMMSMVSLVGNRITKMPDDLSEVLPGSFYFVLQLTSNPVTSLPASIRPDLGFGFLSLEHTNVSELPDWAFEQVYMGLFLYGTPLCSTPTENPAIEAGCTVRDSHGDGGYPFSFVSSRREL